MAHAADYVLKARTPGGKPVDPVARFHLGNGAQRHRLNWRTYRPNGLRSSAGLMVNYLYELHRIEENHEAYAHRDRIATSGAFDKQLAAASAEPAPSPAARGARLKLP